MFKYVFVTFLHNKEPLPFYIHITKAVLIQNCYAWFFKSLFFSEYFYFSEIYEFHLSKYLCLTFYVISTIIATPFILCIIRFQQNINNRFGSDLIHLIKIKSKSFFKSKSKSKSKIVIEHKYWIFIDFNNCRTLINQLMISIWWCILLINIFMKIIQNFIFSLK